MSSLNSSRESSIHSDTSSIDYIERVQAIANNPIWAKQIDNNTTQTLSLSYMIVKEETDIPTNLVSPEVPIHIPHVNKTNNICAFQSVEPSIFSYTANQFVNLQLWDGSFCPVSLFGMNEYLEGNTRNITCSLLRIVAFIKQQKLEDKIAENIAKFGFVAWKFLSAIYEASLDKLAVNKNNKSFRQCVSAQFNKIPSKIIFSNKSVKGKQVDISRISLPISPRPSKNILAKLKFFKKV